MNRVTWLPLLATLACSRLLLAQDAEQPANSEPPALSVPSGAPVVDGAAPNADPELVALFERAREALLRDGGVTFNISTRYEGMIAGLQPETEAFVRLRRDPANASIWSARSSGRATKKGVVTEFDVAWGPRVYTAIDHATKSVLARTGSQNRGMSAQLGVGAVPPQFIEPQPFTREVRAATMSRGAAEVIDGVECEVVIVQPGTASMRQTWWLATTDGLPRRIERVTETTRGSSRTMIEMKDVRTHVDLDDAQFTIATPDGYTREEPPASVAPASSDIIDSGPGTVTDEAAGARTNTQPTAPATPSLPVAPIFSAVDLAGTAVSSEALRGTNVLLFFGGTWSLPSIDAEPIVQAIHDEFSAQGWRVIALAVRERSVDAVRDYVTREERTYTLIPKADAIAPLFDVVRFPTFVFVNADGRIFGRIEGWSETTEAAVRKIIQPETATTPNDLPADNEVKPPAEDDPR